LSEAVFKGFCCYVAVLMMRERWSLCAVYFDLESAAFCARIAEW